MQLVNYWARTLTENIVRSPLENNHGKPFEGISYVDFCTRSCNTCKNYGCARMALLRFMQSGRTTVAVHQKYGALRSGEAKITANRSCPMQLSLRSSEV
jgi:hypothetical protein